MSHEMYENDSAMYYKEAAWHGLGTVVEDAFNPRQALKQAGLDWTVDQSQWLDIQMPDGKVIQDAKHRANVRSDTGDVLGWVGTCYQPLQNSELAEIAYSLNGSDSVVESCGSLFNGGQVYFLIRGESFDTGNGSDTVERYMLLTNGHDGMLRATAKPTSVRVVCNNTLTMALNQQGQSFGFTHNGDMAMKIQEAKEAMSLFRETGQFFKDAVGVLNYRQVTTESVQKFWTEIYQDLFEEIPMNPENKEEERAKKRAKVTMSTWAETFDSERQVAGTNMWNAFNAVTNWMDHKTRYIGTPEKKAENRLHSNLFGKTETKKKQVFKAALAAS